MSDASASQDWQPVRGLYVEQMEEGEGEKEGKEGGLRLVTAPWSLEVLRCFCACHNLSWCIYFVYFFPHLPLSSFSSFRSVFFPFLREGEVVSRGVKPYKYHAFVFWFCMIVVCIGDFAWVTFHKCTQDRY